MRPQNPHRKFRSRQGGYIGIGNRRAVGGGQTWEQYIQSLLDGSPLYLPLTHSAIPVRSTGETGSFTRATTATAQMYEGLERTALAGEARFVGVRRVYNEWTTSSVTLASGGNKSLTLAAGVYQFSMGAGTGTATFSGTGGATGTLAASASARVSVAKTVTAGTFVVTASVADLNNLQVCSITGETDQTTIRPYVSVGVESAPAYHGSMVDGVKCFPTDLNGNPIPVTGDYPLLGYEPWEARTNICLQSNAFTTTWADSATACSAVQNAIGPDGATSAWTLTDDNAGFIEGKFQSITLTAAIYTTSVFVKKTVGAQSSYPVIQQYTGTVQAICTVDTTNGVATAWTAYTGGSIAGGLVARCTSYNLNFWRVELSFTATAAAWPLLLQPAGTANATQSTGAPDATAQGSAVFYGAQVELGSFASPYIPTTTIPVTRNADVLTYTGGNTPNFKSLRCAFMRRVGVTSVGVAVGLTDGTGNNAVATYLASATAATFAGVSGGATQWSQAATNAYSAGSVSKMAQSLATNAVKVAKDGVATTNADFDTATIPVVTQLQVGHQNGLSQLNGPVGGIYAHVRVLSQAEVTGVTT